MAVTIPSFTKAGLPNTPTAGDLARMTDNVQGAWMADGTMQASWFSLLGEVVNIRDFGATGDPMTDDGPAIQNAINAATGIVYVPPGTYLSGNEITLKLGLTILGAGYQNSTIKFTEDTRGFVYEPSVLTEAQIRLSGLRIRGAIVNVGGEEVRLAKELVYVKNAAVLYFDQLNIRDTSTVGLYVESCYVTFMNQLRIENTGNRNQTQPPAYGIHLKSSNVWSIAGCDFQGSTSFVNAAALFVEQSGFGGVRDSNFEANYQSTPAGGTTNAILLKGATCVEVAANFMETYRESVINFRDLPSFGVRIALNSIDSSREMPPLAPENLVDASSGSLAHEALIIEQNSFGFGTAGGNCFNPGQTTTFAYRMNLKPNVEPPFTGTHVFGYIESDVEKGPFAVRQKALRPLNEGSISGATPSVRNLQYAEVHNSSSVTMTGLTDGVRDQLIILRFEDGNTTVQSGGNFRLAGKTDKTFAALDTLTLLNVDGGSTWVEVCRSIN